MTSPHRQRHSTTVHRPPIHTHQAIPNRNTIIRLPAGIPLQVMATRSMAGLTIHSKDTRPLMAILLRRKLRVI